MCAYMHVLTHPSPFCPMSVRPCATQNRILVLELQALVERYRMMDVEVCWLHPASCS